MSWPTAYRGGATRSAVAVARAGIQSAGPEWGNLFGAFMEAAATAGRLASRYPRAFGLLKFGGRFLGAVGLAITVVELYRLYKGGWSVAPGWTVLTDCGLSPDFGPVGIWNTCGVSNNQLPSYWDSRPMYGTVGNDYYAAYYGNSRAGGGGGIRRNSAIRYAWPVAAGEPTTEPRRETSPIYGPIAAGGAVPVPGEGVPPALGPRTSEVPYGPQGGYGDRPAPEPSVPWNRALTFTPSGTAWGVVPFIRAVPHVGTGEQKLQASPAVVQMIAAFNGATEYCDMVGALFKGLPKSAQAMAGGTRSNCLDKQAAVFANLDRLSWATAIKELIWEGVEDGFWAKLGLPTREAGLAYGTNAPVNTAIGQLTGDQMSRGLKAWREAFDAGIDRVAAAGRNASPDFGQYFR